MKRVIPKWMKYAAGMFSVPYWTLLDHPLNRLTSSLAFYRNLLGIHSVKAVSDNELHLEYDVSSKTGQHPNNGEKAAFKLVLQFDPATKRLANGYVSAKFIVYILKYHQ